MEYIQARTRCCGRGRATLLWDCEDARRREHSETGRALDKQEALLSALWFLESAAQHRA
jgi:hypothetical protein